MTKQLTEPSPQETGALHQAFADFANAAPWTQIDDGHIVVHHHPRAGDTYATSFGRLGEVRGINAYIGDPGFRFLTNLALGGPLRGMDLDAEFAERSTLEETDACFAVSADRDELTAEERRLLRAAGIRYRGRGNWVQARRATPGFLPYRPDANETRFMTVIIEDIIKRIYELLYRQMGPVGTEHLTDAADDWSCPSDPPPRRVCP